MKHIAPLFLNIGVILERRENNKFEQAQDPIQYLWTLVQSKLIKKLSAICLFGSFALFRLRSTLLRMTFRSEEE